MGKKIVFFSGSSMVQEAEPALPLLQKDAGRTCDAFHYVPTQGAKTLPNPGGDLEGSVLEVFVLDDTQQNPALG